MSGYNQQNTKIDISLNQEDFFSFGDFTKDELNIYLNKNKLKKSIETNLNDKNLLNKTATNINKTTSAHKQVTSISQIAAFIIPSTNSATNNCIRNTSLHGVEVPWNIDTTKLDQHQNQFNFADRKESVSSSYSASSPPVLLNSHLSESTESLKSYTSSDSNKYKPKQMDTQIEHQTSLNDSSVNASESAQQRRNKKRKPPNYYQSAEYAAILKTSDETNQTAANVALTSNESSNDLIKNEQINNNSDLNSQNINEKVNLVVNREESNKKSIEQVTVQLPQSQIVSNDSTNDELEDKIQNLTLKPTKTEKIATNIEVKQVIAPVSSIKPAWASLFKAASSTAPLVAATATTVNNTQQNNNKKQANHIQKPQLTSSTSLPISPSSSSVSSTSSTSSSATTNHVHLNGVNHATTTTSTANNATTEQSSNDVLKLLGTMFKQCELKHSAPALQPRGIRNKQNWCYVNATLQALLACPPFYNLIKSIFMKIKSSNTNIKNVPCIAALGRFISEFKTMVRVQHDNQSKQSNSSSSFSHKELVLGEPFEVDYFYDTLANLKAELTFKQGRQEDAQEFLSLLLNRLHDEMVKCLESLNQNANIENNTTNEHSKTNGSATTNNHTQEEQQADEDDEWKEVGKKNRAFVTRKTEFKQSPLSDIFCGQFRSALSQPGVKDKESVSLEPFFTLPLDIQSDSVRNVQQALEHFVQKEEVYGFTNQETKQEIEAFKRISFEDLPPVLILYLKCFVYDKQGGIQKLLKRIDFQIDLEINKELISPNQRSKLRDKKRNYKLFAVEYHQGDKANGGHYITDVYHPGIIGWVRYDDSNVRVINNAQVLKSEDKKLIPYLLYYRRADLI